METEVSEEKLREFYNTLKDSSGDKLSFKGFMKLNQLLYLNRTEKEAKEQFKRLDKDASDYLDFEEVKTLLRENWKLLPERREELKAQLDKFIDGEYINSKLLSEILTQYGDEPIDQDKASMWISDLDWNADGLITKDELTVFILKGNEWNYENIMEKYPGDADENLGETGDTEARNNRFVKKNKTSKDEYAQDEEQNINETETSPREVVSPNRYKSKHGNKSSDSEDSSQEELSEDNDSYNEDSGAEKTSDDDKATRKAEKEAKKQAKKEAKRAKKAAKKAKKDDLESNRSADDLDAEEKEA